MQGTSIKTSMVPSDGHTEIFGGTRIGGKVLGQGLIMASCVVSQCFGC